MAVNYCSICFITLAQLAFYCQFCKARSLPTQGPHSDRISPYSQILDKLEKQALKSTSLFCPTISDEEKSTDNDVLEQNFDAEHLCQCN